MYRNLRHILGVGVIRATIMPMERRKLDANRIEEPLIRDPNSGVDRVLAIFDRNEYGTISPELSFINIGTFLAAFIGGTRSGIQHTYLSIESFKRSNELTLYESTRDAGRKMANSSHLAFYRGFAKGAIRYGVFTFSLLGLVTVVSKYRDKLSITDFSISGLITGALYKTSLGPKGMISGGFFGGVIGSFYGVFAVGLLKLSGTEMQDVYNACHLYFRQKDRFFHGAYKTQLKDSDIIIDNFYRDGIDSMSHKLDALEDLKDLSELKFNQNRIVKMMANSEPSSVGMKNDGDRTNNK